MTPIEELCEATRYHGRTPRVMTRDWVIEILARTGYDIDPEGVLFRPVGDGAEGVKPLQHGRELFLLLESTSGNGGSSNE